MTYSPERLALDVVAHYYGITPPTHQQEAPPMIQIRTAEGILSLSNASDVRTTAVLCVRGHKGVTLGYVAPAPAGGWLSSTEQETLERYVTTASRDQRPGITLEQAAAALAH